MIAQFKKNSYQWSSPAIILIILLACVSLPDAERTKASQTSARESIPPIMLRRVWSGPDVDILGAPSPDGRYLSYVDWKTGDLAIYEIATGKKRRLTNKDSLDESGEYAVFSRWSPDGKQIVYQWYNENEFIDLYIIGLDGSKPRILYSNEDGEYAETYDWSPDGRQILACFYRKDGTNQMVLFSAADGSVRVLKILEQGGPVNMSFSPDGNYIVYDFRQKEGSPERDISLLSIDGSREIPLVEHPANDYVLGWAPDGKNILFASDRTGILDGWVIQVADGKPQGVPELVKPNMIVRRFVTMGFTKDGSFYYGCQGGRIRDVYIAKLDPETGEILDPPKKVIKRFEGYNQSPDYSPDGKYLAYISTRGTFGGILNRPRALCIRSLKTGEEREFFPKLGRIDSPRWSPDSRAILFAGRDDNNRWGIYQIDAQRGIVTPVVPPPEDGELLAHECSRDEKVIFYGRRSRTNDLSQIMLREIESGTEKELYRTSDGDRFHLSCSPDGKWLAFINSEKGVLRIIPATGGEPRELYRCEQGDHLATLRWTPDGKYILFVIRQPEYNLWRIPIEGGKPEKLGLEMGNLSVHPDGQHIAFYNSTSKLAEVWVMENFLPGAPIVEPEPKPTLRQVWSGHESPWQGKISPDGRYFSFVDGRDLAVLELTTGNIQRLTNIGDDSEKREYAFFSRWSPDSKQIVYEYNGDFSELRIVGLDGSEPRILYRNEERGYRYIRPHDWSPDGKQVLAFLVREDINQIVLISVDDGAMRTIKTVTHGQHPYQWSFSPDGRHIVYESPQTEDSPESDIFLFSIDDKREVPIVEHPASDRILGWAPDSDWLVFVSDRTGNFDAWAVSVAEGKPQGEPELIKKGIGNIYPMGFSQDGAFYYTDSKRMKDIYTVTINPETGKIDSLPNTLPVLGLGGNSNPQYSPDGKYLAYTRGSNLCIFSFEAGKIRKFPSKFNARDVRWSPDGKYILFNSFDAISPHRIYRLEVQTGNIIPILPPEEGYNFGYGRFISFNEWSHDGKSFFYVETDRGNKLSRILNRDFETGNERELYRGPEYISISLSPDGRWLAFAGRKVETEINVMPASGGEPRELCKIVQPANSPTPLAWTADGRYVLFSTIQVDTWLSNLWCVPKEGGEPQKLGLEMDEIYNLTVHPDGRQIAFYSAGPSSKESEVWVMENFLSLSIAE